MKVYRVRRYLWQEDRTTEDGRGITRRLTTTATTDSHQAGGVRRQRRRPTLRELQACKKGNSAKGKALWSERKMGKCPLAITLRPQKRVHIIVCVQIQNSETGQVEVALNNARERARESQSVQELIGCPLCILLPCVYRPPPPPPSRVLRAWPSPPPRQTDCRHHLSTRVRDKSSMGTKGLSFLPSFDSAAK